MRMLTRAACVLAVSAATVAVTPTAFAAVNDGNCTSGEVCLFEDYNYGGGGGFEDLSSTDNTYANNNFPNGSVVNEDVSSGFAIDRAIRFFVNTNQQGNHFTLGINQYDPTWSTNQPNARDVNGNAIPAFGFNNKVSSHVLYIP